MFARANLMWLVALVVCAGAAASARAAGQDARKYRLDAAGFLYTFGSGSDYGPWWGLRTKLTTQRPGSPTGIIELVTERHEDQGREVGGALFVAGLYKDWTDDVFSASFVGGGTGEPFAKLTMHHEINLKLLRNKEVVLGAGGGYVDFQDVNQSAYLSVGASYFWNGIFRSDPVVLLHYQYRHYYVDPVAETAPLQIISVSTIGPAGSTILQFVRGSGEYLTGGSETTPFQADASGNTFSVGHTHRISDGFGLGVQLEYLERRDEVAAQSLYRGFGVQIGVFRNL